jgi:hypothetical protein
MIECRHMSFTRCAGARLAHLLTSGAVAMTTIDKRQ